MRPKNSTKNQHFLSQTEQRLNSRNPGAKSDNQRIYSFSVVERDKFTVSLDDPRGRTIESNLSFRDLFSFDVDAHRDLRKNFEELFQQYEAEIDTHTGSLLAKLDAAHYDGQDIKTEIINLFAAKLINLFRNPYSIRTVLKLLAGATKFIPTAPDLRNELSLVLSGNKPHQAYLCSTFGISPDEYKTWLGALFMLLARFQDRHANLFEDTVKGLFEESSSYAAVFVHTYAATNASARCLLSDRSLCQFSVKNGWSFDFNLCSTAFIRYAFADIDTLAPANSPPHIVELYKRRKKHVIVTRIRDEMLALAAYNQAAVTQCYANVFCSITNPWGVTVVNG